MKMMRLYKCSACALIAVAVVGCETHTQSGALIGGLGGAALGGAIGSKSHARAGEGAAIGAVAGVIGGALVGHAMDENEKKKAQADRYDYDYERKSPAYSYDAGGAKRVTTREVIDWTNRGVKDEIIIDRVERSGQVFNLTAAEESQMRDAGVSSSVIRSMKDTARR